MRVLGFISIVVLVLLGIYNGGDLSLLLDAGAILIVLGTALGGFLMSAGTRTGAVLASAFSQQPTVDGLQAGRFGLRSARYGALTGGFLAAGAGIIHILRGLGDLANSGPGLALMILGMFWAVFLANLVLLPLQAGVERRLAEAGSPCEAASETSLDFLVLGGGFASGVVLQLLISALMEQTL